MSPELPKKFKKNNFESEINPDPKDQNKIIWVDSNDVYQPISKSFREFAAERNIQETSQQVYIKENVRNNIWSHLATNLRIEQGGILFGNAYKDPDSQKIYVEITAAVPAPATMGTGAYLEFTSDSWMGIMNHAQRCHTQENIVGWYHSHPNLGVFMSGTDMNTQRAFFHHPWCLSIVHDPVRKTTGYFLGETAVPVQPNILPSLESWHEKSSHHDADQKMSENFSPTDSQDISRTTNGKSYQEIIVSDPSKKETEQRNNLFHPTKSPLIILVSLIIVIIGLGSLISLNIINSSQTSKIDNQFNAVYQRMPKEVFVYLQQHPNILRYQIVEPEKVEKFNPAPENHEIAEFIILQLSKNTDIETNDVYLAVEKVKVANQSKKLDYLQVCDSKNNQNQLYREIEIPLTYYSGWQKYGDGVLVALPTYKIFSDSSADSSSENITQIQSNTSAHEKTNESQTQLDYHVIYYCPRRLTYKDSDQQLKEIKIDRIIKKES